MLLWDFLKTGACCGSYCSSFFKKKKKITFLMQFKQRKGHLKVYTHWWLKANIFPNRESSCFSYSHLVIFIWKKLWYRDDVCIKYKKKWMIFIFSKGKQNEQLTSKVLNYDKSFYGMCIFKLRGSCKPSNSVFVSYWCLILYSYLAEKCLQVSNHMPFIRRKIPFASEMCLPLMTIKKS